MGGHMWGIFEGGKTLGLEGSEKGRIIRDEKHVKGARITLEEGCGNAPFAITCGIYGIMVHTAFASNHTEALLKYENMKKDITDIFEDEDTHEYSLSKWMEQFVDRYS